MSRRAALALLPVLALAALAGPAAGASRGGPGPGPARASAALGALIAPASACPGQPSARAPLGAQLRAMRCMTNYARARAHRPPLSDSHPLDRAAAGKSADQLRCDEFSHEACGREFTFWMRKVGYLRGGCFQAGENIGWGTGSLASERAVFSAWIHSPGHRANILGDYEDLGLGLAVGDLEGNAGAHVWTQEFGSRGC